MLDDYYMPYMAAFKNADGSTAEHARQTADNAHVSGFSFGMTDTHLESILQLGGATASYA